MSNEGVKHFLQATGFHTSRFSLHLQICISHYLSLFHVALTYLGKPQSHQKKPKPHPTHPKPHIFCCHGYGASKVTARQKSSVWAEWQIPSTCVCLPVSRLASEHAARQTDRAARVRTHRPKKRERKKKEPALRFLPRFAVSKKDKLNNNHLGAQTLPGWKFVVE